MIIWNKSPSYTLIDDDNYNNDSTVIRSKDPKQRVTETRTRSLPYVCVPNHTCVCIHSYIHWYSCRWVWHINNGFRYTNTHSDEVCVFKYDSKCELIKNKATRWQQYKRVCTYVWLSLCVIVYQPMNTAACLKCIGNANDRLVPTIFFFYILSSSFETFDTYT